MSSPSQKSQLHALGFLILAMLSVQSSASLAKVLFQNFPVLTVSAMRLCMGAFILAFIFQIWKINFSQVRWKAILSYGFALAGMNALFYLSLERLPIGIAVAFEFIGPLSVALYHAKQNMILSGSLSQLLVSFYYFLLTKHIVWTGSESYLR